MAFSGLHALEFTVLLIAVAVLPIVTSYDEDLEINGPRTLEHNLVLGNKTEDDRLLYSNGYYESGRPNRKLFRSFRYIARNTEEINDNAKTLLTYIEVLDLSTNNTGAYVSLGSGGIGKSFVRLRFISQKSYGINFNITLYGKAKN